MNESFDQHDGQSPPGFATGSRQAGHNGGSATSNAMRPAARNAPETRARAPLGPSPVGAGSMRTRYRAGARYSTAAPSSDPDFAGVSAPHIEATQLGA